MMNRNKHTDKCVHPIGNIGSNRLPKRRPGNYHGIDIYIYIIFNKYYLYINYINLKLYKTVILSHTN